MQSVAAASGGAGKGSAVPQAVAPAVCVAAAPASASANAAAAAPAPAAQPAPAPSAAASVASYAYGLFGVAKAAVKAAPAATSAALESARSTGNGFSSSLAAAGAAGGSMLRSAGLGLTALTTRAINGVGDTLGPDYAHVPSTLHMYHASVRNAASGVADASATAAGAVHGAVAPHANALGAGVSAGLETLVTTGSAGASAVLDSVSGGVRRTAVDSGLVSEEQLRASTLVTVADTASALLTIVSHLRGRMASVSTTDLVRALQVWGDLQSRVALIEREAGEAREHAHTTALAAAAAAAAKVAHAPTTASHAALHTQTVKVHNAGGGAASASVMRVVSVQTHRPAAAPTVVTAPNGAVAGVVVAAPAAVAVPVAVAVPSGMPLLPATNASALELRTTARATPAALFAFAAGTPAHALHTAFSAVPAKRTSELYPPLPPPKSAAAAGADGVAAAGAGAGAGASASAGDNAAAVAAATAAVAAHDPLAASAAASASVAHDASAWHVFSAPPAAAKAAANAADGDAKAPLQPVPLPPSLLDTPPHARTPHPTEPGFPVTLSDLQLAMKLSAAAYGPLFCRVMGFGNASAFDAVNNTGEVLVQQLTGIPHGCVVDANWSSDMSRPGYFLAVDHVRHRVWCVCRGTSRVIDAFTDLQCDYVPVSIAHPKDPNDLRSERMVTRGWGHEGIVAAAEWFDVNVKPKLYTLLRANAGYRLWLSGHSLGAAVPSVLSLFWMSDLLLSPPDRPLRCVAFGPPCVVSLNISVLGRAHVMSVSNGDDLVPRLCKGSVHDLSTVVLRLTSTGQSDALAVDPAPSTAAAASAGGAAAAGTAAGSSNPTGHVSKPPYVYLSEVLKTRSAVGSEARAREDEFCCAVYRSLRVLLDGEHLYPVGHMYSLWPVAAAKLKHLAQVAAWSGAAAAAAATADAPGSCATVDAKHCATPYSFLSDGYVSRVDTSVGHALFRASVHPLSAELALQSSTMATDHMPNAYDAALCGPRSADLTTALPISSLSSHR